MSATLPPGASLRTFPQACRHASLSRSLRPARLMAQPNLGCSQEGLHTNRTSELKWRGLTCTTKVERQSQIPL
eukprot:1483750-Rhodomonas_salina.1